MIDTAVVATKLRARFVLLAAILLLFAAVSTYLLVGAVNTVSTLRQSSARNECRTTIKNASDDRSQHALGEFESNIAHLIASGRLDPAEAQRLTRALVANGDAEAAAPTVQSQVDAQCPAPLVSITTITAP